MANTLDQIFVLLQHWILSLLPVWLQPLAGALLSVIAIIVVFAALFAISVLLERKGLGRMQNRIGPNRVGPLGILQPVADGIKALIKEDVVPYKPITSCISLRQSCSSWSSSWATPCCPWAAT